MSDLAMQVNGEAPVWEPVDPADVQKDTGPLEFDDNVVVTIKKPKPLNIEIDLDNFTIADMEFVAELASDKAGLKETIEFIRRVVPEADTIPMRAIAKVTNAIITAIGGASDPNASAPGSRPISGQAPGNARPNTSRT